VLEEERPTGRAEIAYVAVGALAMYAHFFAVFVLVAHLLAAAITGRSTRRQLLRLAAIGVLVVPLALFALVRDAGQVSHLARPTPSYLLDTLRQLAGGTRPLLALYGLAVLLAAASWLRAGRWRRDWPMANTALWAVTPVVGAVVVSLGKPLFAPRFLIVAMPGIVLLAVVGLARLPRPLTIAAGLLVLALSTRHVLQTQGMPMEDFRAATAYVLADAQPGDAVAFYRTSRRIPFEYYARREGVKRLPRSLLPRSSYGQFDMIRDYRHTQITSTELAAIGEAASRGRIWLFLSRRESERVHAKRVNRARLLATVERNATLRARRLFAGLDIRLYVPTGKAL
jgi:hypothetical protein